MNKITSCLNCLLVGVSLLIPSFADNAKNNITADRLLAGVRYATTLQKDQTLNGFVRKSNHKIPFGIQLKQGNILFNFTEDGNNWKTFELKFKEKNQELYTYLNGKAEKFSPQRYTEKIEGTDLTYEDLSMRFLYWPHGKILPQDHTSYVKGRKCFVVDLPNPNPNSGEYAYIRTWIDEENGALWQIDAFNAQGQHLKRFSITQVMKSNDQWFFKQMRIELRDPNNPKKTRGVNYIEMN